MTELLIAVLTSAFCVYCTSAVAKLRSRAAYLSFVMGLAETKLIRLGLLPATAAALVSGEALAAVITATAVVITASGVAGASTVTGLALGLAIALTGVLTAGIAVILSRGTQARCACFGSVSEQLLGRPHLARNAALLGALTAALICNLEGTGRGSAGGIVLAALVGGVIGLLLIRLDDIVELFTPITSRSAG